jgi:hypothetical protein
MPKPRFDLARLKERRVFEIDSRGGSGSSGVSNGERIDVATVEAIVAERE